MKQFVLWSMVGVVLGICVRPFLPLIILTLVAVFIFMVSIGFWTPKVLTYLFYERRVPELLNTDAVILAVIIMWITALVRHNIVPVVNFLNDHVLTFKIVL
jgi:hypothetical protein